jgi:VanZ family protein
VSLGALDEWRQLLISGRHGDTGDLLVDCLGAAAGVVCAGVFQWIINGRVENEPAD